MQQYEDEPYSVNRPVLRAAAATQPQPASKGRLQVQCSTPASDILSALNQGLAELGVKILLSHVLLAVLVFLMKVKKQRHL